MNAKNVDSPWNEVLQANDKLDLTLGFTDKFNRNKFTVLSTSGRIFRINILAHLVNRINLSKFLNFIHGKQAGKKTVEENDVQLLGIGVSVYGAISMANVKRLIFWLHVLFDCYFIAEIVDAFSVAPFFPVSQFNEIN